MLTQKQHYELSVRRVAETDKEFLWFVENGMTRKDLETNIKRRPSLWSRYLNWLDKLP